MIARPRPPVEFRNGLVDPGVVGRGQLIDGRANQLLAVHEIPPLIPLEPNAVVQAVLRVGARERLRQRGRVEASDSSGPSRTSIRLPSAKRRAQRKVTAVL